MVIATHKLYLHTTCYSRPYWGRLIYPPLFLSDPLNVLSFCNKSALCNPCLNQTKALNNTIFYRIILLSYSLTLLTTCKCFMIFTGMWLRQIKSQPSFWSFTFLAKVYATANNAHLSFAETWFIRRISPTHCCVSCYYRYNNILEWVY